MRISWYLLQHAHRTVIHKRARIYNNALRRVSERDWARYLLQRAPHTHTTHTHTLAAQNRLLYIRNAVQHLNIMNRCCCICLNAMVVAACGGFQKQNIFLRLRSFYLHSLLLFCNSWNFSLIFDIFFVYNIMLCLRCIHACWLRSTCACMQSEDCVWCCSDELWSSVLLFMMMRWLSIFWRSNLKRISTWFLLFFWPLAHILLLHKRSVHKQLIIIAYPCQTCGCG